MPQDLVRRINIAQRAISSRTSINVLECIRFEAKEGWLYLTATDLELAVITRVPCEIEEEGVVVIPAAIIGNIFRKLPTDPAVIETKNNVVDIDCGAAHFAIQVPNASDYPELPRIDETHASVLDNEVLQRAIRETEFAASTDETKIALTGIYMMRTPGMIRFVAVDGYRLAMRTIDLDETQLPLSDEVIIPRRAMTEMMKILTEDGQTQIKVVTGHIVFDSGDTVLMSRLIDKKYLNYEEIISRECKTEVSVSRMSLQNALERASLLAKEERANLIRLTFDSSSLRIESNSEIGHVNEQVSIGFSGDPLEIAFNAKYLLEGLRAMDCETLVLRMNGPLNQMIIRQAGDEEHYLYLVLPVRMRGNR